MGREARDYTIWTLHEAQQGPNQTPCAILSMNAEKAFNRENWAYMTEVRRGLGLGDCMMGWVLALFTEPRARV